MDEKKTHPTPPRPTVAQKIMKGTREFEHHLFRLRPAKMKKNISYKYRLPQIVELEHEHIYHSLDGDTFEENEHSAPVGGHFHKVEFDFSRVDPRTGGPVTKCGPPLQKTSKFISGMGQVTRVEGVRYELHPELGKGTEIIDDHVHEVMYIDTELLTAQNRQALRATERAKIASAQEPGAASTQPAALAKTAEGAEKGKQYGKEGAPVSEQV